MESVSGGSRIYSYTPTLGSVVNSIKWNHTNLVVERSADDKKIYICGKRMRIVWECKKMRIVYNVLQNSKFEEQRINRELDVILKEMQEVQSTKLERIRLDSKCVKKLRRKS